MMVKSKSKLDVRTSRNSKYVCYKNNNYKTWLTIGVSVVVLAVLFAVFYPMIVSE